MPESVEYVEEKEVVGNCYIGEFYGKFASEDHLLLISNDTIVASSSSIGGSISEYTIPDGVIRIGNRAFYERITLEVVNMPNSVKTIGPYAFSKCSNLKTVNLSTTLEIISYAAFCHCGNLKNITLPNSFRSFEHSILDGNGAFCTTAITEIAIPEGVVEIPHHTFTGCAQLASIYIPEGVKKIGSQAFLGCSSLTTITLPSSLEVLEGTVFDSTQNLSEVCIMAIVPPTINGWIFGDKKDVKIKVPSISVDAYKAADGWNEYAEYIEAGEF